ncbi:hypothetical protein AB0L13_38740 [Saccharopolyspora shandongensis]
MTIPVGLAAATESRSITFRQVHRHEAASLGVVAVAAEAST